MEILFSFYVVTFVLVVVLGTILMNKLWWTPIYIQYSMRSQGIKGPPYKFLFGNNKEIFNMKMKSMSAPMELSHDIFPRISPHFHAWITLYGKNFINWVGHRPQLIVTEPEHIREVLNDKEGSFPKLKLDNFATKLLGDGLATIEGEKWVKMRKLANHAFHAQSLKNMVPEMMASIESMLNNWTSHEGKEIEVYSEFKDLSSEIISRTAFGSSYLEGKNIFEMLTKLGFIIFKNDTKLPFLKSRKYFKTADDKESDELEKSLRGSIMSLIKKREEQVMTGRTESYGSDFLGLLLKAHHDAVLENRITVDNIVDECKTFYFAGHETLSSALSWTVFLLAIHTDWQDKAREELLDICGAQGRPRPECFARLRTMTMIINETLRLYSPITILARRVRKKSRLGKLTLPPNLEVLIPTYSLHGNPQIWGSDAHLFKPERFADGVSKATNYNTAAFLPFGAGPRTCVGLNFATTQVKIALSMILRRYKFTLSPNYSHTPFQVLTVRPQQGVQILLHPL